MAAPTRAFALIVGIDAAATSDTTAAFNSTGYTHVAVWVKHEGAAVTITPSDNKGSTAWSKLTYRSNANADLHGQWMWAPIGAPGTGHTITVSFTVDTPAPDTPSARPYVRVAVMLVNSSTGVLALAAGSDVAAEGSGTAPDAGSITTAEAALLLMAVGEYTNASYTPSSGWTEDWDPNGTGGVWSFGASRVETSGGTFDPFCTQSASAAWVCGAAAFVEAAGGGPNITGSSSANPQRSAAHTVTGSGFGATQGTKQLRLGGVVQTPTAWADGSITYTLAADLIKSGVAVNVEIWETSPSASLLSNSFALTSIQPQAGWGFVDVGTPDPNSANRLTFTSDAVITDQCEWFTDSGKYTVRTDLTVLATGYGTFGARLWTAGSGYGSTVTQTINPSIWVPASDIYTPGWEATPTSSPLYSTLNETTLDDADYVRSPRVESTINVAIWGLEVPAAAGTYTVNIRAAVPTGTAILRVKLTDDTGAVLGTSADQVLTSTLTTYSLIVTLTGTSTRVRVEVES